jgi:hypothetical protein
VTPTGPQSVEALCHLLKPADPARTHDAAVFVGDDRYGGFRDADHAAFFVRQMGWEGEAVIRLVPREARP